jgi:hypothetical protein
MSHKEDLRVREARKAARIVAAERGVRYQQALDLVAQDAGAPHWSGFMTDASLSVSLSTYQTSPLTFDGQPADVDPIISYQRMARSADSVARGMRELLGDGERLVKEGEGLVSQGRSPSAALSHAALLIEQVESLAAPLDDLVKDVLSLYDGQQRRSDQVLNVRTPRQHYRDIQERIAILKRRIAAVRADASVPAAAENAVDYYHRMRFGRTWHGYMGDSDIYEMACEEGSPDSLAACYIFYRLTVLMRNMPSRMDREQGKVLAEWTRWTGYALHNLPQVASGAYDHHEYENSSLVALCKAFVRDAGEKPIPAYWHPEHPEYDRWKNMGELWVKLCDFIASRAGMPPEYGVPMEILDVSDDVQPFPELPEPRFGFFKAAVVTDYAKRMRSWAEWASRGRRILVQRWNPELPEPIVTADMPYGERADRSGPEREMERTEITKSS